MRVFFHYFNRYRWSAAAAMLMMFIELAVELSQPFIISIIIDKGIAPKDTSVVTLWTGILLASMVFALLSGILSSFLASHASQGVGYDVREALYRKVQEMSYATFNRFAASSLITRLTNDVSQLQELVFSSLRFFLRIPLIAIGGVTMALIMRPTLGVFLLITLPLLLFFVFWVMKRASKLFRAMQQSLDKLNGAMQESFIGMRLIRIFVRRKQEGERFARYSRELMDRTVAAMRLAEITVPFTLLTMNAAVIAVLWFGKLEINTGSASVGEVVAIINYSLRTTMAISLFSMIIMALARARTSAARIEEALGAPSESVQQVESGDEAETRPVSGSIVFDEVTFRYPDADATAVADLSFSVAEGETVAVMGATGAGKSTLVQLILRLYEPDSGTVLIDGKDARAWSIHDLLGGIGYVPQEVLLFTGSIRDNIAWGLDNATDEQIIEAAKLAQIHETIMNFPDGYDTMLGQRGVNLSGGQKQRVSIARALIRKPAILLLDDSTSALDQRTEQRLLDGLRQTRQTTTILVTQKITASREADRVILLDEGRVLAQGSHEQLAASEWLYQRICESQLGEESVPHEAGR